MNTQALELQTLGPGEVVKSGDRSENLLRYAIEKGASVETIERLMNVRRELRQEQAKEAFDAAMADFQSACPVILKRKLGAKDAYKYAPLEDILESRDDGGKSVKELIRQFGFSHSATTEIEQGWVKAVVTIKHIAGHSEKSEFKAPVDTRNPMMNDPQRYGGALTFALRYAFKTGFGILTADEDLDGRINRPKPKGPSKLEPQDAALKTLKRELWETLKSIRGTEQNWNMANAWLWREEILDGAVPEAAPELSERRFKEVIKAAKERLARV
jgi:hypothetical protein